MPVGGLAAERHARAGEHLAVVVVELVAVAVALAYFIAAVALVHTRAGQDMARIRSETQRCALVDSLALVGQEVDYLVRGGLAELAGVCVREAADVARKFDDGYLHTEADAEIGDVVLTAVFRGGYHALDAAVAEAAWDDYSVAAGELRGDVILCDVLAVDPADIHLRAALVSAVVQRLGDGEIRVVKLHIFADKADGDLTAGVTDAVDQRFPLLEIWGLVLQPKLAAHNGGKPVRLEHERRFVEIGQGQVLDDAVGLDVAEHGDLSEDAVLQRLVAAQDDDVRRDTHALKLLDGVLGGLGLVLVAAAQEGDEGDVDEQGVAAPLLKPYLADRLDEGLALDIAGRAADLGYDDVGVRLLADAVNKFFYLVRDVRDDLHGLAEVFAAALLVQHVPVDLAGGEV